MKALIKPVFEHNFEFRSTNISMSQLYLWNIRMTIVNTSSIYYNLLFICILWCNFSSHSMSSNYISCAFVHSLFVWLIDTLLMMLRLLSGKIPNIEMLWLLLLDLRASISRKHLFIPKKTTKISNKN